MQQLLTEMEIPDRKDTGHHNASVVQNGHHSHSVHFDTAGVDVDTLAAANVNSLVYQMAFPRNRRKFVSGKGHHSNMVADVDRAALHTFPWLACPYVEQQVGILVKLLQRSREDQLHLRRTGYGSTSDRRGPRRVGKSRHWKVTATVHRESPSYLHRAHICYYTACC